jgi:hypothetical protein
MSTITVVSNHRVELRKEVIQTVPGPDKTKVRIAKVLETVLLEPGVQKQVGDWVLENPHFKMLEADGVAQAL